MNKTVNLLFLIILSLAFQSCGKLYLAVMGVKPFRQVEAKELKYYLEKEHQLINIALLELDPSGYSKLIAQKQADTSVYHYAGWYVQNHIQPLQTICYDTTSKRSLFAFFNCIAETRHINQLTWNKYHELDTFPPKEYGSDKWNDSLFSLNEISQNIRNAEDKSPIEINAHKKEFTVLVFYSLAFEKQANNLIRETQHYLNRFIPGRYAVYYVNCDNFLFYQKQY
jgi:hypothetical protein